MTAEEGIERLLRWGERFLADVVLSTPVLLDWEMISRVQQFNNAHPQSISISIGGITTGLSNTGVGYNGKDAAGNIIPLALPSPIQILEAHLAGNTNTSHELLVMVIPVTTVKVGTGFQVTLTASSQGAGPFVLCDDFNTALLLPPLSIGSNTVTASPSVFTPGTTTNVHVKDQATGISSNSVLMTWTT